MTREDAQKLAQRELDRAEREERLIAVLERIAAALEAEKGKS